MQSILKRGTDILLGWLGVSSDSGGWDRWVAFLLVILFAVLFDFLCRLLLVRNVRRFVERTRARWDDTLFSVRVLRNVCHVLSAICWPSCCRWFSRSVPRPGPSSCG